MSPTHGFKKYLFSTLVLASMLAPWQAYATVPGCESTSTDLFKDYYQPGWNQLADYPDGRQKIIIASDPQAFRYMSQRFDEYIEEVDSAGWQRTAPVYEAIARERNVPYHVPVVVNGDITEYGHSNERIGDAEDVPQDGHRCGWPVAAAGVGQPRL